ncbi:MAG: hypothetical protein ACRD2W_24410 [Acidimicrobiales bacterium]
MRGRPGAVLAVTGTVELVAAGSGADVPGAGGTVVGGDGESPPHAVAIVTSAISSTSGRNRTG